MISLIMMMICSTQANTTQATPARIRMAASSGKIFLNYLYRHFCENLNQNLKTAVQTHHLHQWSFKIFGNILLSRWKCSFLSLSVISFSWTLNTKCMKAKMTKRSDAKIYGSSHMSESFSKGCFQNMLFLNLFFRILLKYVYEVEKPSAVDFILKPKYWTYVDSHSDLKRL